MKTSPWSALLVLLLPSIGLAQSPPTGVTSATTEAPSTIVVLTDGERPALVVRLRAELRALGFEVIEARDGSEPGHRGLSSAARARNAAAAMRVRSSQSGLEVWVRDRITGKTLLREVVVPPRERGLDRNAVVAVQAVELLRASLLEVTTTLPPRGEVPPPPEAEAAAIEVMTRPAVEPVIIDSRWRLMVIGAAALSPGGLPPSPHVGAGLSWRPWRGLVLRADVMSPTVRARRRDPEGATDVSLGLAGVGLDWDLWPAGRFDLTLGVGVAAAWLRLDGEAAPGLRGQTDHLLVAYPYLRAQPRLALTGPVSLLLDARLGFAAPRPVVVVAGRTAAHWGRPAAVLGLGLEVGLDGPVIR